MKTTFRFLFVALCLFTTAHQLSAQWVKLAGTSSPTSFAVLGTNLFVGTTDAGVYAVGGSTTNTFPIARVSAFAVSGTNLLAGTIGDGVFLSTNNATSWSAAGMTGIRIYAMAVVGTRVFSGNNGRGVYVTTDNGTSWTTVNTGLTDFHILSLASSGTNLYAGTTGYGICLSTNNGASWSSIGLTSNTVSSISCSGTNIFAGTDGGLFLSTNNGVSWTAINSGLTSYTVSSVVVSGTSLFAGTDGGVFLSINNGASWTATNTGLTSLPVSSLVVFGGYLYDASTYPGGVCRRPLTDFLTSVEELSTELPTQYYLAQNYPNPFNPSTTISFSFPFKSFVTLKVFDAMGREVSTLLAKELPAGTHTARWDAAALPSGVYIYRLQVGHFSEAKKLVLQK